MKLIDMNENNYFSPSDPSESSSLSSYSPPINLAFLIFWRLTFVGFCGSAISHFNSTALLSVSVASSNAVLPSLFTASKSTFLAASFWSIWITAACPEIDCFQLLFSANRQNNGKNELEIKQIVQNITFVSSHMQCGIAKSVFQGIR